MDARDLFRKAAPRTLNALARGTRRCGAGRLPGAAVTVLASLTAVPSLHAAEGGASFYLLGSRGPMAGFTPPPGVFFQNDFYIYSGNAKVNLDLGGKLVADVHAQILVDLSTALWVTPWQVMGGNLEKNAKLIHLGIFVHGIEPADRPIPENSLPRVSIRAARNRQPPRSSKPSAQPRTNPPCRGDAR